MFLNQKMCLRNVLLCYCKICQTCLKRRNFLWKGFLQNFFFAFQYTQNIVHCGANLCKLCPVFVHLYFKTETVSTLASKNFQTSIIYYVENWSNIFSLWKKLIILYHQGCSQTKWEAAYGMGAQRTFGQ